MYKVYILLVIVILILILGNMFITREGFYQSEGDDGGTTAVVQEECTFEEEQTENDCNKVVTEQRDEFLIHNVCPLNPKCLGVCINDFTWTEENKKSLGIFDKSSYWLKKINGIHFKS